MWLLDTPATPVTSAYFQALAITKSVAEVVVVGNSSKLNKVPAKQKLNSIGKWNTEKSTQ